MFFEIFKKVSNFVSFFESFAILKKVSSMDFLGARVSVGGPKALRCEVLGVNGVRCVYFDMVLIKNPVP